MLPHPELRSRCRFGKVPCTGYALYKLGPVEDSIWYHQPDISFASLSWNPRTFLRPATEALRYSTVARWNGVRVSQPCSREASDSPQSWQVSARNPSVAGICPRMTMPVKPVPPAHNKTHASPRSRGRFPRGTTRLTCPSGPTRCPWLDLAALPPWNHEYPRAPWSECALRPPSLTEAWDCQGFDKIMLAVTIWSSIVGLARTALRSFAHVRNGQDGGHLIGGTTGDSQLVRWPVQVTVSTLD